MTYAGRLVLTVALVIMSGCSKERGDGFEGEIDMTSTTADGSSASVRYFIKGQRVRMETSAALFSSTTIVDISTNDVFVLDDAKKSYRAVSGKPAPPSTTATAALPTRSFVHPASSGNAVIAGVPCALKSTKLPTGHVETCACEGLNLPSQAWSHMFGADPSGAFILKRELFDTSGTRVASMEANRIEHANEPTTLFVVPADYVLVK